MQIDKNSIFYHWNRVVADFGFDQYKSFPNNVCALFWFIVAAHVVAIAKVLAIGFMVGIATFFIVIGYLYPFAFVFPTVHEFFGLSEGASILDSPFLLFAIVTWGATLVILGAALTAVAINSDWFLAWKQKRFERRLDKHQNGILQEKSSGWWGVVVAYIKSKKDKVCPIIEYVRIEDEA